MGFLHEGHIALLDEARKNEETVVMSLFVNPLQFGDPNDLDRYPRDRERDLAMAEASGVDIVFAPTLEEMYPSDPVTRVVMPDMTTRMEGAHRPGHFAGVATVVTKLFAGVQPDRAYFGRKDAQQLAIVTRMAADLSLPATVVPNSTVREPNGLALSSRNIRLSNDARNQAVAIGSGLMEAADAIEQGDTDASAIGERLMKRLTESEGVEPEYAEWATTTNLESPEVVAGGTFLATAAHVGGVRLIDNIHVDDTEAGLRVDRGVRIDRPSMLYKGDMD